MEMYNPSHPGRIIRAAMGKSITVTALAKHLGVTRSHLSMILNGRAGISALMSLKLDETFDKSEGFFFRIQEGYDLAQARRVKRKKLKPLWKSVYKEAA
ncbi:MAG TPA: HigA family addiction module antitoxin [Acidobacteriaceae bacterium]